MADPITLGTVATVASGAGSGISAIGALMGGQSASRLYQYRAAIALQNRDYALATGELQAQRYGMQARQRMGALRAGIGAQGIDIGSGSKANVTSSQQTVTDIDLAQIRNNAARKAYDYTVEATGDEMASTEAVRAGKIKALGSLVSGAGSVASKWYQGGSVGLNSGGDETLG